MSPPADLPLPTSLTIRSVTICATTIVSANYLAYAKVLADSVRKHFSTADFVVLVVDRKSDAIARRAAGLGLHIVWAEDLGLPDFERIAYQFDILELNTGLKPTLLKHLLARGHDSVIYWDPDIRLFAAPDPVVHALSGHSVVLTPHTLTPLMDGRRPSDIDLLRHGAYNLGFIAVRGDRNGMALLDWWEDRCLTHGYCDLVEGIFVDQKWLDLAPSYFDGVHILKHRGCNVAYWNLHERPLTRKGEQLVAGDVPLVFYHFSGVNPRDGGRLSKHQDRHGVSGAGQLNQLVADYCTAVMDAGHADIVDTPYTFGFLDGGQPVSALMRRALTCAEGSVRAPFAQNGRFQQDLRRAGLWPHLPDASTPKEPKVNAFNFDGGDRRLKVLNRLIRGAFRLLGQGRSEMLLRYLVFLGRGSHFAAVLTRRPFMMEHRSRAVAAGQAPVQSHSGAGLEHT